MIKGIYASGSGMQPRMLRLEVLANNLANIDTTGYKKENIFVQVLEQTANANALGKGELEGLDVKQYTDFSEGSMRQTNNPLDLAIEGRGFFVVETPQGARYTRNGNFMLAGDGTVVTLQGQPVLGASGKIQIPQFQKIADGKLSVSENGEITLNQTVVGKFKIVDFDNLANLKKEGSSMFHAAENERPHDAESNATKIRQGYLEESNVEGIAEMIAMVELNRSFETDQKSIQYQDSTLERAMDVGRV
ncbi:MAG: flagellar basal-body rod protein FlgF [Ignavibacteriales bacterium]|nr:flagellar basal-body rod protein FlgF [Ignavibacteriales bacterium]